MSTRTRSQAATVRTRASLFAALGDETRLSVLGRLSGGQPHSIASLTSGTQLTRQAVTKHLRVLAVVGVVRSMRVGRESLYELDPKPLDDARAYLEQVSRQWDAAILRLKAHLGE